MTTPEGGPENARGLYLVKTDANEEPPEDPDADQQLQEDFRIAKTPIGAINVFFGGELCYITHPRFLLPPHAEDDPSAA